MKISVEELREIDISPVEILSIRWKHDDSILAIGGSDGVIRIYSTKSFLLTRVLSSRTITAMPVTSLSWRPQEEESDILANACSDGWIFIWHASSGFLVDSFRVQGEQAVICEYSPEGNYLAIGIKSFAIKIFNAETLEEVIELESGTGEIIGHSNTIFAIKWINNEFLVSGGWDRTIIIWDVFNKTPTRAIYGPNICGEAIDTRKHYVLAGCYGVSEQVQVFNIFENGKHFSYSFSQENRVGVVYAAGYNRTEQKEIFATVGSELSVFDSDSFKTVASIQLPSRACSCDWGYTENILAVACIVGRVKIFLLSNDESI